jgi:hypothetical protein
VFLQQQVHKRFNHTRYSSNNPTRVPKETKDEIIVMFFCNIGISRVASSISL